MNATPRNLPQRSSMWSYCERFDCFGLFGDRQPNLTTNRVSVGERDPLITTKITAYSLQSLEQCARFRNPVPKIDIQYNYKHDPSFIGICEHESSRNVLAKGFGGSLGLSQSIGIPLGSLFNVMIGETKIDRASFLAPLTMGDRNDSAGPHGPFFAVLFSEDLTHKAYLVPNHEIKEFLAKEVNLTDITNKAEVISKITTYREYYLKISGADSCRIL